jgi:uncharacterized membrane protein
MTAGNPRTAGVNQPPGCAVWYPKRLDTHERVSYAEIVGRSLVALGVLLVVVGLALEFAPRLPFRIGRLPGDIYIHRGNTTFFFPIVTCVLLSVVLTLVLWIFNRR